MLYLDAPVGPFDGLTIFRDHADDSLFYYMNDRPRLARNDGVPEFVFLKYTRDITDNPGLAQSDRDRLGGGFLAFTVDLSVDQSTLDDARGRLARFAGAGPVNLAPALFTKGTVRLSITKDAAAQPDAPQGTTPGAAFFEEVYGTTMPSLIGDNRATFGVMLDHEGATLMEAALRSGISPIGVIYDLEYLGLRPAFDVKIHADYHRVYTELDIEFGVKASYATISAAVDIDLAWQKLRDNGSITVQVKSFTDDADLRKQADAAFDWFKTQLLQDFFKSSLEPPMFLRQGQSGLLGSLQQLLGPMNQTQQGPSVPAMGAPTTAAPTVQPPPANANAGIASTGDANRQQAAAATAPGGANRPPSTGFGAQVGFSLKRIEQDELKERDFEMSEQSAVTRTAAPQGLFSTMVNGLDLSRAMKEVNLDDDFFKHIDATFTLGADLAAEKIGAVSVNVEYPAKRPAGVPPATVAGFPFTPADTAAKHFQTFLDEHKELAYRYKVGVQFAGDSDWVGNEASYESDWIETTAQAVNVDPFAALDRLDIEVVLGDDVARNPSIKQVQIDLAYDSPDGTYHAQKALSLKPGDPSQHWRLRFAETGDKVYRSRVTYFLDNNVRIPGEWTPSVPVTTSAATLVVNSPFRNTLNARLVSLLDPAATQEADISLVYAEPAFGYEVRQQLSLTSENARTPQSVAIPTISPTPGVLTATTTVVRADGSVFHGQPVSPDNGVLVVSDGAGAVKRVQVQLANPNLAAAGLVAVRVRLAGPGDDGDRDEAFFTGATTGSATVTLVQPTPGPFSYSYEVVGYTTAGLPLQGAQGTTADAHLVVPLPTG